MKKNIFWLSICLICLVIGLFVFTSCDDESSGNVIIQTCITEGTNKNICPSDGGVGTVTWYKDTIYILKGLIFVNEGQTLTIQAGTVIKGQPDRGEGASALIVARGAKIMAEGTADDPIIFTGLGDDLNGSVADNANGMWGGVMILGKARNNNLDTQGEVSIEGIRTDEIRGQFGGNNDADNSGVFKYVSIRHGGSIIGANNEINGLTLGSVGSGTTIEYVEIFSNLDDGIEFFGGTVNVKNVVIAHCGDDGIDTDLGYRGNLQNVLIWHTSATLESDDPRSFEMDGGDGANESEQPYGIPHLANITVVFDDNGLNMDSRSIYFRDNSGGKFYNSIFLGQSGAVDIERRTDRTQSSYNRYIENDIVITNNIFYNINNVNSAADFANVFQLSDGVDDAFQIALRTDLISKNQFVNPFFGNEKDKFKPNNSEVKNDLANSLPSGLTKLPYKGAVDPDANLPFFANWTKTWQIINQ